MKNDRTDLAPIHFSQGASGVQPGRPYRPIAPMYSDLPDEQPFLVGSMHPSHRDMSIDEIDDMYPEIYHTISPLVAEAASQLLAAGITPTPEAVYSIVDTIIRNSGMWYEDEDDDLEDDYSRYLEAIPAQFGFGRPPYRRRRRGHHSRNTLRDLTRILLLNELIRNGNCPTCFF